jgi:hypothetical protein
MQSKIIKKSRRNIPNLRRRKAVLYQQIKNMKIAKVLQFSETITSSNGNAYPIWSTSGNLALNVFNRAFVSQDFADMNNSYQLAHFKQIKVTVSRLYTENSVTGIYGSGIPQLMMAYFPAVNAGSLSTNLVIQCETSSKIEPYHVTPYTRIWHVPSAQGLDSTSAICVNMGQPFDALNIPGYTVPGVLGIAWNPNGNAASTTAIVQVTFQVLCEFSCPF